MFQEVELNYFKVPAEKQIQTQLIGVLDASGSMSNVWKHVAKYYNQVKKKIKNNCALTFDTKARSFPNVDLKAEINMYGGGGTSITTAFQELNKLLLSLKDKKNVTILFVSDGQGDYKEEFIKQTKPKIENLNFICIGVGGGFPTFISMSLRQLYHNGDTSIPPLFLITDESLKEQNVDLAFQDEFLAASKYFSHQVQIKISPCYQFPWADLTDVVWAGSWVTSYQDELECDKGKLEKVKVAGEEGTQIAAFWLQNLQLLSLKQKVPDQAKIALNEISKFIKTKKLTFLERVKEQRSALNDILTELRNLAASQTLQQLDEATAAQRLKIGTQIGKYHKYALKMKGVSVEGFQAHKEEFIRMIEKTKFVNHNFPSSVISLQNQIDILTDPELIEGFNNCETQYHLVSSFPIIGHGLFIQRTDKSRLNPFAITVESIAKLNKYIDSLALIDAANHTIEFNIGADEKEVFNCLVPLYSHEIMIPFLRSNIFHLQMTFLLMENADTCFDSAYAGLLGNALLFMISQEESQWKHEMIELINSSFILAYAEDDKFKYHTEHLIKDPVGTLADDNLKTQTKCDDITKTILVLNQIKNNFTKEQLQFLVKRMVIEAISREVKTQTLFKPQIEHDKALEQNIIDGLVASFTQNDYDTIPSFDELRNQVKNKVSQVDPVQFASAYLFDYEKFEKLLNQTKFSIKALQYVYRYFLNEEISQDLFIVAAFHSRIDKSYERTKVEVEWDTQKILNLLLNKNAIEVKMEEISDVIVRKVSPSCINLQAKNKQKSNNHNQRMPRVERRRIRKQKLRQQKLLQQQQP